MPPSAIVKKVLRLKLAEDVRGPDLFVRER